MSLNTAVRRIRLPAVVALAVLAGTASVKAQVEEVFIGVTPRCPYGLSACWGGAYEGLSRLEGVESVSAAPDAYNCTAQVRLKKDAAPDPEKWSAQFKSVVGENHVFRGVEVTVKGTVDEVDGRMVLRAPGIERPVRLAPLEHKLQWNFKKEAARQPEPDERDAHGQLARRREAAGDESLPVHVTGPLRATQEGYVLEVREFFPASAGSQFERAE